MGDYIVSQGVLAKVAAVQAGNNQLVLSVTPATLNDAFTSFKISAQGVASQNQLTPQSYSATFSPRGVQVQPQMLRGASLSPSEAIPWGQVQCSLDGSPAAFQFTQGSIAFNGLIPTPTFNVTKDPSTGVEAFTAEVSAQPTVTITSPTLTFNPSLTGTLDCNISLNKVQLPTFSFYGIVSLDFDVTPVIGFTASATLSAAGSASFTGPQLQSSMQYDAGFNWTTGQAPSAFHTVSAPTVDFTPFAVTAVSSPSLNLDFQPYAKAIIGMGVGVHALFINLDAAGLNFSEPKIGLDTKLGLSSLPSAYTQSLATYQGPAWSANLDGGADFNLQITGALQTALHIIGFSDSISLGSITFLNVPVSGSPQFSLTGSATTADAGSPVTFTVTQATVDNALFPENDATDTVQFWEMGSSGSPSLLGTRTLSSSGTASYDWLPADSAAGNDSITALIFGLFGDIALPYASNSFDVSVTGISADNSTIAALPVSIPADGATAANVTVQLYDTNGQNVTVGGDTVQIASTVGTVSPVTDNNDGTYTAQVISMTAGTAVLSFTVNGAASTNTANVSVMPITSNITVSATTPASSATGVSINSAVSATFSGSADASTLTTSTFTLIGPGGPMAGTVTYDSTTKTATFTPSAALANSTAYTATVTTGIKDLAGNSLASDYSWSFTTVGSSSNPKTWGNAQLIESGDGPVSSPEVAVDANGNAMTVWFRLWFNGTSNVMGVFANRFTAGVGWGTESVVGSDNIPTSEAGPSILIDPPSIAVAADGTAIALWREQDPNSTYTYYACYANRYVPGQGWGTAQIVMPNVSSIASVAVAMDSLGNAIALCPQYVGASKSIFASRYTVGQGWGAPEQISSTGIPSTYGADLPLIGTDGNGNAIAIWAQWDGSTYNLYTNRYIVGQGWETAGLLQTGTNYEFSASNGNAPKMAVDNSGNAVVVWGQYDGGRYRIFAKRYDVIQGWGESQIIDASEQYSIVNISIRPQIAVDDNGNAIAVWDQTLPSSNADNTWANRYIAGQGWSNATVVEENSTSSSFATPEVAMDASGEAVVVWSRGGDIWSNQFVPAQGWGTAVTIETNTAAAYDPQVGMDNSGNATAVWRQSGGTADSIWANRLQEQLGGQPFIFLQH